MTEGVGPRTEGIRALEVVGPFHGTSGYDRHTRAFVRGLAELGVRIRLHGTPGWSIPLPPERRDPWFDTLREPVGARVALHFTMPSQARPAPALRNANYTMFEADRIPLSWVPVAHLFDRTVVPTESSLRAWAASGADPATLRIAPLGVDGAWFRARAEPLDLRLPDGSPVLARRHRFLNVAELRPRKNHLALLRAWMRATRRDDDAVLILKGTVFQARALDCVLADVREMQAREGMRLEDAAPVLFLHDPLADDEVRSLFAAATHYWSMSHGEGWDQVTMEAAVSGLELLVPWHTAYPSYLRPGDAHTIPARKVPCRFEGRLGIEDAAWFHGLCWWDPDESAAAALVRGILDGRVPPVPPPSARLAAEYTWLNAARALLAALDELADRELP